MIFLQNIFYLLLLFIQTTHCEFDVLLINLNRRPDKLQISEYQLKRLNISNYTRIAGVDGKELLDRLKNSTLSPAEVLGQKYLKADKIYMNNPGQIGCSLSHLKVMKHIIDKNITRPVLVFEDDFLADGDAINQVEKALKLLPFNWGLFYAGHCHGRSGTAFQKFGKYSINKLGKELVPCTHAYLINGAKFAKEYLETGNTKKLELADFVVQASSMSRYIIYPFIFSQLKEIKADIQSGGGSWPELVNKSLSHDVKEYLKLYLNATHLSVKNKVKQEF